MTPSGESDISSAAISARKILTRPTGFTRIELPEHRPVIDVMECCGPEGAHIWINLYREQGAFLTIDQALELARALKERAANTAAYVSRQLDLDKGDSP